MGIHFQRWFPNTSGQDFQGAPVALIRMALARMYLARKAPVLGRAELRN